MYLTGNEKPDFGTICNFKRECRELIEETFKKTVTIAKAVGILSLGHISTEGIYAFVKGYNPTFRIWVAYL